MKHSISSFALSDDRITSLLDILNISIICVQFNTPDLSQTELKSGFFQKRVPGYPGCAQMLHGGKTMMGGLAMRTELRTTRDNFFNAKWRLPYICGGRGGGICCIARFL